MYEVKVTGHFCAAHYLKNYKGKCESMHGHNWKVEAVVAGKNVDSRSMLIDFKDFKKILNEVLDGFDHSLLNELAWFKKHNTTSEMIARYIFEKIKERMKNVRKSRNAYLKEVLVWEQDFSCAVYRLS